MCIDLLFFFFFFNDTATTEIYTLSLHDALPIYSRASLLARFEVIGGYVQKDQFLAKIRAVTAADLMRAARAWRSEEHTSELQSLAYLVCRLLLEKKKKDKRETATYTDEDVTYYN